MKADKKRITKPQPKSPNSHCAGMCFVCISISGDCQSSFLFFFLPKKGNRVVFILHAATNIFVKIDNYF